MARGLKAIGNNPELPRIADIYADRGISDRPPVDV